MFKVGDKVFFNGYGLVIYNIITDSFAPSICTVVSVEDDAKNFKLIDQQGFYIGKWNGSFLKKHRNITLICKKRIKK